MAEQAYAYVTLVPVAKGFQSAIAKELSGIEGVGSRTGLNTGGKFVSGFGGALKGLAVAGAAVAGFATASVLALQPAITAASNFFAEFEGVNQVFGEAAGGVQEFAASAATNLGISETSALNASKQFGIFASAAGLSGTAAAQFSTQLVTAAADLGSFNDVPVEETLAAIQSGLQGSSEPLRRFGIFLDDNAVKAYAMEQGLGDVYDNMTSNEKTLLRQQALIEQLGVQSGDFANYADTYGNAVKTIQATFQDLQTEIGLIFMPLVENMAVEFAAALGTMQDPTTELGGKWELLKASFQTLADAFQTAFDQVDVAALLGSIVDGLTAVVNGFMQAGWLAGEVGKIISQVLSGEFEAAGQSMSTFGTRYNAFVQETYKKQDKLVNAAVGNKLAANNKEMYEAMTGTGKFANTPSLTNAINDIAKNATARGNSAGNAVAKSVVDYTKQIKNAITDARKDLIANRKDYNKAVARANENYAKEQTSILNRYDKVVTQITKRRDEDQARALKDYQSNVAKINEDTVKKLADVVKQSQDRLRNAFQQVASTNVGALFASDAINKNIGGLIDGLRTKLTQSRQLIANAAKLASEGFSQTFIEQVVAAGGETGNQLAEGILNATPEQRQEMKDLFNVIESEAETGMDSLAKTLYEKNGLATTELKSMYAGVLEEQRVALAEQKTLYDEQIAQIMVSFNQELADAKALRDEALVEAETALNEALLDANEAFLEGLDEIDKDFKEKINGMKSGIKGLKAEITALQTLIGTAKGSASATIAGLRPMATGGLVTGPTPALIGEAGPELVIPLDRFESLVAESSGGKTLNYYAAPNQSVDSEQALFEAMRRAKVVTSW